MLEVDDATFRQQVVEAEGPVLVDFWGPRCAPCLALLPTVEALAEEYQGQVKVVKVNAMKAPLTCRENKVMSLPAFIGFSAGVEVCREAKDVDANTVRRMLQRLAGKEE